MKTTVLIVSILLTFLLFASIIYSVAESIFGGKEPKKPYILFTLMIASWAYMFYIL